MTSGWRPSTVDLLELRDVPRRYDTFRFDLCDIRNHTIGELHPDLDKSPAVTWDTTRDTQRSLDSFYLPAVEQNAVNKVTDRVRVWMVLQNGDEYSLGVFLWTDANEPRRRWGYESQGTLLDKTYILNQPLITTQSIPRHTRALGWFYDHVRQIPEFSTDHYIDPDYTQNFSSAVIEYLIVTMGEEAASRELGSPVSWQGGTTHLQMGNDIMGLVGYLPLHCDRNGTLVMRAAPDVATAPITLSYDIPSISEISAVVDAAARIGMLGLGISWLRTPLAAQGPDIDVTFEVTPLNPQPTGSSVIAQRWGVAGQRSWQLLRNNTTGRPFLNVSADGTATSLTVNFATATLPLTTRGSYRLTYRGSTRVATWYTGTTVNGPWTQVEASTSGAAVVPMASTVPLLLGADPDANTFGYQGAIHAFRFFNGIGGPETAGWNAAEIPDGTSNFYGRQGELWELSWCEIFNDSRAAKTLWSQGRIIEESVVRSIDILTAPNYVVVTDTSANSAPVRGVWRAPAAAPHSEAKRGYAVGRFITMTGLASQADADLAAQREGDYLLHAGHWMQWQSPADPRHEPFNVLAVTGYRMLEDSWSLTCVSGQPMRHKALRIYPKDA